MYRIGTAARLAQVSVRTLRHYDDLGLLRPARVEPATGYRWYGAAEMARLHRILVLRDLGVPLGEIATLLDDDVTPDELRGILLLRRAEAHERIAAEQQRLARVEARIDELEGDTVHDHDVTMKDLDPVAVVAASETLTAAGDPGEITAALGRLYPRLHHVLAAHGVAPGPLSYALYDELDDDWQEERVTAALAVTGDVTVEDDGVHTVVLPAARAAATVVRGAPEEVFAAGFAALRRWLDATGAVEVAQLREVYFDCDGPRATWVTELQAVLASPQATPTKPASVA
jgi:DNA-binding transcriptional MerR regulator